jgi:hypothetical protein
VVVLRAELEVSGTDLPVEHDCVTQAQLRHHVGGANRIQQGSTGLDRVGDRDEMRVKRPGRDRVKQLPLGRLERLIVVIGPQHRRLNRHRFALHTINGGSHPGRLTRRLDTGRSTEPSNLVGCDVSRVEQNALR